MNATAQTRPQTVVSGIRPWPCRPSFERVARLGALLALVTISGCANLSTVSRSTELPAISASGDPDRYQHGRAVHLDAQQRLFYQVGKHFCAEPMPDALQAIASSTGGSADVAGKAAAISTAFSTSAASIGLHTQSTTLMRDQFYRICELAANTNMSPPQVAQLMERAQRYTLGILAVEQLTGAVAAQQAVLTGDANSAASAELGTTLDMVNKALAIQSSRKTADQLASDKAKQLRTVANQSKTASTATGHTADAAETQKVADDEAAAVAAEADAKQSGSDFKDAQDTVDTLRKNLGAAKLAANAAAKSGATLQPSVTSKSTIDKDTADTIAKATTAIVQSVLSRGDITDSCMAMMMDPAAIAFLSSHTAILSSCTEAIANAVAIAKKTETIPFRIE